MVFVSVFPQTMSLILLRLTLFLQFIQTRVLVDKNILESNCILEYSSAESIRAVYFKRLVQQNGFADVVFPPPGGNMANGVSVSQATRKAKAVPCNLPGHSKSLKGTCVFT